MSTLTIALVGDHAVGKSCVAISYATYAFPTESSPSINSSLFTNKDVGGVHYTINFAEVGQYDDIPEADVYLVVYSIVDPSSLDNAQSKYVPDIKNRNGSAPIILVGNKSDLRDDAAAVEKLANKGQAPVTTEHGQSNSKKMGVSGFVECSALTQKGLQQAFDEGLRHVAKGGKGKKSKSSSSSGGKKTCVIS